MAEKECRLCSVSSAWQAAKEEGRGHTSGEEGGPPVRSASLQCPYLHDGPGPRRSAVVVVDIVGSPLSVLPLLPTRRQPLRGEGESGGRGRLHHGGGIDKETDRWTGSEHPYSKG